MIIYPRSVAHSFNHTLQNAVSLKKLGPVMLLSLRLLKQLKVRWGLIDFKPVLQIFAINQLSANLRISISPGKEFQ